VWRKTLNEDKIKIFIGYDSREDIAYQVARHSILETTKRPDDIEIIPLKLDELRASNMYWREEDKLGSTEFTFSRFLIPELCNFDGWALFIDCDFLFKVGVEKLFEKAEDQYAVMCVHHDYTPTEGEKMDGKQQVQYPRKNWSSMVLWNCSHPANKKLTKELVNNPSTTGKYLHRFSWLDDSLIGKIRHDWNWLVGWYKSPEDGHPAALHYTEGGPWFKEYETCEYAADWLLVERSLTKQKQKTKVSKPAEFDSLDDDKKDIIRSILNYMVDKNNYYYNDTWDSITEKVKNNMGNKVVAIDSEGGISYKTQGLNYDPILRSMAIGSQGQLSNWEREQNTDTPLLIRGLGGGSRKAIENCKNTGRTFYAVDTGYFGNTKTKWIHRVSKNNLQHIGPIIERDNSRAKKFGYKFKKFTKGTKILICPPSLKVMEMFKQPSPEQWVKQTVRKIRQFTDRPIEIRLKPNRTERVTSKTIQAALRDDIHCLVTYNSIASIEALMEGKPALVLGPNAAEAVCETQIENIDTPKIPTKEEMIAFMAHIAYCQFTIPEMESGFAWRTVNESSELPLWNPTEE
jgi:lipopolysaccharide biosynthesis glycosyltransferase